MKTILRKLWHDLLACFSDPRWQVVGFAALYLVIILAVILGFLHFTK